VEIAVGLYDVLDQDVNFGSIASKLVILSVVDAWLQISRKRAEALLELLSELSAIPHAQDGKNECKRRVGDDLSATAVESLPIPDSSVLSCLELYFMRVLEQLILRPPNTGLYVPVFLKATLPFAEVQDCQELGQDSSGKISQGCWEGEISLARALPKRIVILGLREVLLSCMDDVSKSFLRQDCVRDVHSEADSKTVYRPNKVHPTVLRILRVVAAAGIDLSRWLRALLAFENISNINPNQQVQSICIGLEVASFLDRHLAQRPSNLAMPTGSDRFRLRDWLEQILSDESEKRTLERERLLDGLSSLINRADLRTISIIDDVVSGFDWDGPHGSRFVHLSQRCNRRQTCSSSKENTVALERPRTDSESKDLKLSLQVWVSILQLMQESGMMSVFRAITVNIHPPVSRVSALSKEAENWIRVVKSMNPAAARVVLTEFAERMRLAGSTLSSDFEPLKNAKRGMKCLVRWLVLWEIPGFEHLEHSLLREPSPFIERIFQTVAASPTEESSNSDTGINALSPLVAIRRKFTESHKTGDEEDSVSVPPLSNFEIIRNFGCGEHDEFPIGDTRELLRLAFRTVIHECAWKGGPGAIARLLLSSAEVLEPLAETAEHELWGTFVSPNGRPESLNQATGEGWCRCVDLYVALQARLNVILEHPRVHWALVRQILSSLSLSMERMDRKTSDVVERHSIRETKEIESARAEADTKSSRDRRSGTFPGENLALVYLFRRVLEVHSSELSKCPVAMALVYRVLDRDRVENYFPRVDPNTKLGGRSLSWWYENLQNVGKQIWSEPDSATEQPNHCARSKSWTAFNRERPVPFWKRCQDFFKNINSSLPKASENPNKKSVSKITSHNELSPEPSEQSSSSSSLQKSVHAMVELECNLSCVVNRLTRGVAVEPLPSIIVSAFHSFCALHSNSQANDGITLPILHQNLLPAIATALADVKMSQEFKMYVGMDDGPWKYAVPTELLKAYTSVCQASAIESTINGITRKKHCGCRWFPYWVVSRLRSDPGPNFELVVHATPSEVWGLCQYCPVPAQEEIVLDLLDELSRIKDGVLSSDGINKILICISTFTTACFRMAQRTQSEDGFLLKRTITSLLNTTSTEKQVSSAFRRALNTAKWVMMYIAKAK